MEKKWLKPSEVKTYCGWSKNTLMKHIENQNVIASQDGGVWKIYGPSIDSFLWPLEDERKKELIAKLDGNIYEL